MKKSELIKLIKECIKESGMSPYSMSGGINPDDFAPSDNIGSPVSFPLSTERIRQVKDPNGKINWNKLTPNEKSLIKRYRAEYNSNPEYKRANSAITSVNSQLKKKESDKKSVRDKFMAYRQDKNVDKLKDVIKEAIIEALK